VRAVHIKKSVCLKIIDDFQIPINWVTPGHSARLGPRYRSTRAEQLLRSVETGGNGVDKTPQGFREELVFGKQRINNSPNTPEIVP
jgi:hypothetical protein